MTLRRRQTWPSVAVISVCLAASCGGADRAPPAPFHGPELHEDGGAEGGVPVGCGVTDAAACAPVARLPPAEPAVLGPDDLGDPACTLLDGAAPTSATLRAAAGHVLVIDTAPEEVPPLRLRSAKNGIAFGEPVTLLYGARRADVIAEAGVLKLLAARQFYAVAMESEDGVEWTELQNVAPDEPTYRCEGFPPLAFARGRSPARFLAMGNDFNDGIFGCHSRVFLARREGAVWGTPVQIGDGEVLFVLDGRERIVVLTSLGVLVSDDGGATFTRHAEWSGSGVAWTGRRLVVARVHDGTGGGVAIVASDDEGGSWGAPSVLLDEPVYAAPFVAADGGRVAVAVALRDAVVLTRSRDHGATWSEPRRVARRPGQELAGVAVRGTQVVWLLVGDRYEVCATE